MFTNLDLGENSKKSMRKNKNNGLHQNLKLLLFIKQVRPGIVANIYNCSTQEANAGESL